MAVSPKVDYHTYMASREWRLKRKEVMAQTNGWCARCHSSKAAQVHHLSYAHLGDESLEELSAVCRSCHEFLAAESENDPREYAAWKVLKEHGLTPSLVGRTGQILSWDTESMPSGWTFHWEFKTTPLIEQDAYSDFDSYHTVVLEIESGIWIHGRAF